MQALITGATGLVGRALRSRLEHPAVLSRNPGRAVGLLGAVDAFAWAGGLPPASAFEGIDAVFHLAGEPVAEGRWDDDKKQRIMDSRVVGTRNLVDRLATLERKPRVLVSASAVGYYGDRRDERLTEAAAPGNGFLADVCQAWEHEAMKAQELGIRVVTLRIGIVLAANGGALERMKTPFLLGAGGQLGDGKQWMPWVHLDDVVGLLLHAATTPSVRGPLNGVAPNPVTNANFTAQLGGELHRPTWFRVPKVGLRLAMGEMAAIVTASQRVIPEVAQTTGYNFLYPYLDQALRACLRRPVRRPAPSLVREAR